ncbi:MAG: hypothetical protein IJY01_07110 [Clostridia bacterium]|nr:hypothetical protein [Clostridia bacterium]
MKNLREIEISLLDGGQSLKKNGLELVGGLGKLVALLCAAVTAIATFTDVSFAEFALSDTLPSLLLLLTSSYIIYFSLEDAGEHLGEGCEDYLLQKKRHTELCDSLTGEDTRALGVFLEEYLKDELATRRRRALAAHSLTEQELEKYIAGERCDRGRDRILRRISRMRCAKITLYDVISSGVKAGGRSRLDNPERGKLGSLLLKLIPSTLCTVLTVSIMLTAKSDMSASDIIGSVLKLTALPVIGVRGYAAGYSYVKNDCAVWYRIRCDIIEEYLAGKSNKSA